MNFDITPLGGDLVVIDGVVLRKLNHEEFIKFTGYDKFQMKHPETWPHKARYELRDGKMVAYDWRKRPLLAFETTRPYQFDTLFPELRNIEHISARYLDGTVFHRDGNVYVPLDTKVANYTKPKIVCLCGSTRFHQEFVKQNYLETMSGNIVLSVGFFPHSQLEVHGETLGCTPEQKTLLDELHKRKIDLADEVFVLNVDGYIGESTASEVKYAALLGKFIRYLE